jgi:hypothetical protein
MNFFPSVTTLSASQGLRTCQPWTLETKKMRKAPIVSLLLVAACGDPPRTGQDVPPCGVTQQAIVRLSPILVFVLPAELGGLECAPGAAEECEERLATQCVAHLSTAVGAPVAMTIGLENRSPVRMEVEAVRIEGDCADWRIAAESATGFSIDGESTATIPIEIVATSAGVCTSRLDVVSDAGNVSPETGVASVVLSAAVAE